MSGFNYIIDLDILGGSAIGRITQMLDRFDRLVGRTGNDVDETARRINRMGQQGRASFDGMGSSIRGWVASLGIGLGLMTSLNAAAQRSGAENAITFASGNSEAAAANLQFLRKTVDDLGLPLTESYQGFKLLAGSMMDVPKEQVQSIFQGVAKGATAMALSADDANGVFLALSQIASKGKVQAEELRGQIGERIPGAFQIAARAMNMTEVQLNKVMETGNLASKDFLPRFAAEMEKTYGGAAVTASQSATANFNRFRNSLSDLSVTVGSELMPTVLLLLQGYLIPAVKWVGQNIEVIGLLAVVFGALWATQKAYLLVQAAYGAYTAIATVLTGGMTAATWSLNAAFWANPIAWVIGLFVALVAGIAYAWNKFEGFRGALVGYFEVLKEYGRILVDFVITPFKAVGNIIGGILSGNADMIKEGIMGPIDFIQNDVMKAGDRLSSAFNKGWNDGVASDFKNDPLAAMTPKMPTALDNAFSTSTGGGTGGGGTKPGGSGLSNGIKSVAEGGGKNITINLGALNQGGITVHTTNMKEGVEQVKEQLMRMLLQVVNAPNQMQ